MGRVIESSGSEVGRALHRVEILACEGAGLEGQSGDRFETLEPCRVNKFTTKPSLCSVLFLGREETVWFLNESS